MQCTQSLIFTGLMNLIAKQVEFNWLMRHGIFILPAYNGPANIIPFQTGKSTRDEDPVLAKKNRIRGSIHQTKGDF